jgi:multidrug efflux pump
MQMRYMGREAIGVEVSMTRNGDILALGKNLRSTVVEFQRELPLGVEVHQVHDQPAVVKRQVNRFMQSLLEALAIVLAIGFFALGSRAGLVVALAIPIVLAITFIGMLAFGVSLQRVSLGALIIALGLLVDDAMITVEMMSVRLARGWRSLRAAAYSYRATALPMLTGTLITVAGFMPVGLANSATGEYTFSLFSVVAIALIASWVVAVVFTPYLGFLLLPRRRRRKGIYKTPFYRRLRRFVTWCVDYRKTVIALTFVVFALSLYSFRFVEEQFFPISDRDEVVVEMWLPEGAPFSSTLHEVERLERQLAGLPGIQNYAAYVGHGAPQFFLAMTVEDYHINFANIIVTCDGSDARDAVYHRLRTLMADEFPAVRARVTRLESGPPVTRPVEFRVLGDDPATLRDAADRVAEIVRAHPATRDVYADWHEVIRTMRLDFDEDRARALGVSPRELGSAISMMLNGAPITQYREGDRLIDVVMRASDKDRTRVESLSDLGVRTSGGRYVPLGQLVVASYGLEQGKLWRRNGSTEIVVGADIDESAQGPDVTSDLEPAVAAVAASLPPGYRIEVGGDEEANVKSQGPILAVIPLMVVVIVTLLMLQLRNFKSAVRVLISAPLGVAGVTLALLVFRQPFGFLAMLGVVALAGIIMRNSVILVEQIERLIAVSQNPRRAIIEGVVRRFRPITLTAAATILAMVPLAQSPFWRPIAVAMMGGTFIATVLTLAFEPAMYALWFGVARRSRPATEPAGVQQRDDADSDLVGAVARGDSLECARWLEAGCDVDARDAAGRTALMLATDRGHHDIMQTLIAAGADVDARSGVGTTALMRAASHGDADACRILIEAGATVGASLHGVTALALAKKRKHAEAVAVLSAAA